MFPRDRELVVVATGVVAVSAVAGRVLLRILRNLPFDPVVAPPTIQGLVGLGTPLVLALALVTLALATERTVVRVGLLFAGVFGLLSVVSRAATLPAVVAVSLGGGLAVIGALGWSSTYRDARRSAVAIAFVAGVTVSLASAIGILDGGFRGIGSLFALGALAMVSVRVEGDRVGLLAGVLALVVVVLVSTTAPYVAGSVLLVGFAVVGVPPVLVALAVAGGTAATVAGLRRAEYALPVGVGLLLLAGVPASLPRAMAVILGATFALVDVERFVSGKTGPGREGSA